MTIFQLKPAKRKARPIKIKKGFHLEGLRMDQKVNLLGKVLEDLPEEVRLLYLDEGRKRYLQEDLRIRGVLT
jgi:hypothetical protein